jgi:hypothetical protein
MGGIKHQIIWSVFSIASIESHMGIYIYNILHVFPIIRWLYEHGIYPHMTYAFFGFFLLKQPVVFHTARDPRCQPEIEKLAGSGQWGGWNKCWQPNPEQTYIHIYINIYLYIYSIPTPLKNMSSSAGIMKFPTEWKNKTCSKPPTTYIYVYVYTYLYIYISIPIKQSLYDYGWMGLFLNVQTSIVILISTHTH